MARSKWVFIALGLMLGSFLVLSAGTPAPVFADHEPDLDIVKNAAGIHNDFREWTLRASNDGDPLEEGDVVRIEDNIDDDLIVVSIHSVHDGWDCELQANNLLVCILEDFEELTDDQEVIVQYDACDTLTRGSVTNTATIFLDLGDTGGGFVAHNTDTANPNVFDCEDAALVIEKVCSPDANANVGFSFDITAPGTAEGEELNLPLDCGDESDEIDLDLGVEYTVTEDMPLPAGWTSTTRDCTGVTDAAVTNGRRFTPEPGDEIVCTFTNTFVQVTNPTLRIDKVCLPAPFANADATFSFDVTPNGSIADPDVDCGDSSAIINLVAATPYTVVEDGLESTDWALTSADCTGVTDAAVTDGRSFTPDADDVIICTFTNTFTPPANPTLVITKVCDPQVDGATFSFDVTPDGSIADPDVDCGQSSAIINLAASTAYTVVEDGLESGDWSLTSADCTGVTDAAVANGRSFTTGTDNVIECTFTNTLEEELGSIRIQKDADGSADDFSFDDSFGCNIPALEDGEGFTCADLPAGLYSIDEDVPGDWDLVDIVCTGDDDSVIDIDTNLSFEGADDFDDGDDTVLIQLAAGENIVCTFFNVEEDEPDETDENDENDEDDEGPTVTTVAPPAPPAPPVAEVLGTTSAPPAPVRIEEVRGLPAAGEGFQIAGQSSGWRLLAGLALIAVSLTALAFRSKVRS